MKTFRELIIENNNILRNLKQGDWAEPTEEIKGYLKRNGNTLLGVFALQSNYKEKNYVERYLVELFDNEKGAYKDLQNSGEIVCRYITQKTVAGNMAPLIKLDLSKGVVYFLKDYDADEPEFEKKGLKLEYIRTVL